MNIVPDLNIVQHADWQTGQQHHLLKLPQEVQDFIWSYVATHQEKGLASYTGCDSDSNMNEDTEMEGIMGMNEHTTLNDEVTGERAPGLQHFRSRHAIKEPFPIWAYRARLSKNYSRPEKNLALTCREIYNRLEEQNFFYKQTRFSFQFHANIMEFLRNLKPSQQSNIRYLTLHWRNGTLQGNPEFNLVARYCTGLQELTIDISVKYWFFSNRICFSDPDWEKLPEFCDLLSIRGLKKFNLVYFDDESHYDGNRRTAHSSELLPFPQMALWIRNNSIQRFDRNALEAFDKEVDQLEERIGRIVKQPRISDERSSD
jgi:hypothetical protein